MRLIRRFLVIPILVIGLLVFAYLGAYEANGYPELEANAHHLSAQMDPQPIDSKLVAGIESEYQLYQEQDAVLLRFTLRNTTQTRLHFLKWGTPFEGFKNDMFQITCSGASIPYQGILVTRGPIQEKDYLVIEPDSELTVTVDLAEGYAFHDDGNCEVVSTVILADVQQSESFSVPPREYHPQVLPMASTEFALQGKRPVSTYSFDSKTDYFGCAAGQQQVIIRAYEEAKVMARNAYNALQTAPDAANAARYITWFGPYDMDRYAVVQGHFYSIRDAIELRDFDWDCNPPVSPKECDSDVIAYVYPSKPYEVHLCAPFWLLSISGTDSQPGVIIHEASHFSAVAGTLDHCYGHDFCLEYAQNLPLAAIGNAASHHYFAENVPNLPMERVRNPVFVNAAPKTNTGIGTEYLPFTSVADGVNQVEIHGVVTIEGGSYPEKLTISKALVLSGRNGTVTIGSP